MAVGLFALVSRERLTEILQTLHDYTALPISLLNQAGDVLLAFGGPCACCAVLEKNVFIHGECAQMRRKAGVRAEDTGEAYIFSCRAGLNQICYPLLDQNELMGSVLIGPFLMDRPDSTLVNGIMEHYPVSAQLALDIYDELGEIPVIAPARVNHLSRLIGFLLEPLLPGERSEMRSIRRKLTQQSSINETIQRCKRQNVQASQTYLREEETLLMNMVKTGDTKRVKALLNDLLGYVLFSEGGDLDAVRIRSIEMTTLLSRVAMDGGAMADDIYELNSSFLRLISQGRTIDELCSLLQDVAVRFMDAMFSQIDKGNAYVRRALNYTAQNFHKPLSLEDISGVAGLSPNYFSRLFRRTVGVSFSEYLNTVRIDESKRLLLDTDDSLTEIALAVGFSDQSYFCKVFRQIVGLTPGKYRG